jgi:L-ribulose-5-phosphate 4-epimerase
MLDDLREQVCEANRYLERSGLVKLTWGNVSGVDRKAGMIVIKPSGIPYQQLKPEHLVVLSLDGKVVEGTLNPSSDTPTHLVLYRAFPDIGGVTHTHSAWATIFAQAQREIPCFGTTHADHFHGSVPVTRMLKPEEVVKDYEANTGVVVVERFKGMDPMEVPAVLVAGHGPFTWGRNAAESVRNSIALESVAEMASATLALNPGASAIPAYLMDRHYKRKHGPGATYGQRV